MSEIIAYRIGERFVHPVRLRKELGHVSLPDKPSPAMLRDRFGVVAVFRDPKPAEPIGMQASAGAPALGEDGYWRSDWTLVPLPVEKARELAREAMREWIEEFLGRFTKGIPDHEVNRWPEKAEAARAYAGTPTARQSAMIEREAAVRGVSAGALAAKIAGKADLFEAIVDTAAGLRGRVDDRIEAAQPEELAGILEAGKAEARALAADLGVTADLEDHLGVV